MSLTKLPARAGITETASLNRVLGRARRQDEAGLLAGLRAYPRRVIERMFILARSEQTTLDAMSDEEIAALVAPVVKALEKGRSFSIRLECDAAVIARTQQGDPRSQKPLQCMVVVEIGS